MMGQLPSGSGSSIPSPAGGVEPLRPAWPSWRPIFAYLQVCTKSTIRFQAGTCSGLYMPVHPGEMRPSRETSVISENTRAAPPIALAPRCTRCQSLGVPSSAQYWHIGDTTTRFASSRSRSRNGVNSGGGGGWRGKSTPLCSARSEEHTSELQSLAYLVCRLLLEKKKQRRRIACRTARHGQL